MKKENKNKLLAFADTVEVMTPDMSQLNPDIPAKRVAPEEILVLKFGKTRYTQDGQVNEFDFDEADADTVIQEFESRGRDLVVDYEHANLVKGQEAPAAGWVQKLIKSRDGLLAVMKSWTDKAKSYLENGEYRYQSPVVHLNDSTRRPDLLQSIGLTNHPAIHGIASLVAASDIALSDGASIPQTIEIFKNRIVGMKMDLDNSKGSPASDSLKSDFSREVVAFSDYASRQDPKVKSDVQGFINVLFLSDLTDSHKPTKKGKSQMVKDMAKLLGLADESVQPVEDEIIVDEGAPDALPASTDAAPVEDKALLEKVMASVEELVKMKDMIAKALGVEPNLDAIMAKLQELYNRPTSEDMAAKTEEVAMSDAKMVVASIMDKKSLAKSFAPWLIDFAKRDMKGFKAYTDSIPDSAGTVPNNLALSDIRTAPVAQKAPAFSTAQMEICKQFGSKPEDVLK